MYVNDIQVGTTALDGKPEIANETSATAFVKGNNLLGPVSSLHQLYLAWWSGFQLGEVKPKPNRFLTN